MKVLFLLFGVGVLCGFLTREMVIAVSKLLAELKTLQQRLLK